MSISGWSSEGATLVPTTNAGPSGGDASKASTLPQLHSHRGPKPPTFSSSARVQPKTSAVAAGSNKSHTAGKATAPTEATLGGTSPSAALRVAPQPYTPTTSSPRGTAGKGGAATKPKRMVPIPPSSLHNIGPSPPTKDQTANRLVDALMKNLRNPKDASSLSPSAKRRAGNDTTNDDGGGSRALVTVNTQHQQGEGVDKDEAYDNEVHQLSATAIDNAAKGRRRALQKERLQNPSDFNQFVATFCCAPISGAVSVGGTSSTNTSRALATFGANSAIEEGTNGRGRGQHTAAVTSIEALKSRVDGFGKVLEDMSALMPDYVSTFLQAKRFNTELFSVIRGERAQNAISDETLRKQVEAEQRAFYEGKLVELLQDRRKLTKHVISLNSEITDLKASRDEELQQVKKNVLDTLERFTREDATGTLQRTMTTQAFQTNIALMDRVFNLCAFIRSSGLTVPGSAHQYDAVKKDIMFGKRAAVLPTLGSFMEASGGRGKPPRRSTMRRRSISIGGGSREGAFGEATVEDAPEGFEEEDSDAALPSSSTRRDTNTPFEDTIKVEDQVGPQFIQANKREIDQCRLSNQQMLISTASDSHRTYRLLLGHKDTEIDSLKHEVQGLNDKISTLQKQIDDQHFDLFKQQQSTMNLIQQQERNGGRRKLSMDGGSATSGSRPSSHHGNNKAPPLRVSQISDPNSVTIKRHFASLSTQLLTLKAQDAKKVATTTTTMVTVPPSTGGANNNSSPAYDPLRPSTPRPWVPFTVQTTLGINIRQPTAALVHELATVALNYKSELEEAHVARKKLVAQLSYVDSLAFPQPDYPTDPPFIATVSEDDWASIPHFLRTRVAPHVNNSVWSQEFTAHLIRKFFEGFEMYSELSVFRRDHKMVEPRTVLIKDRRKHITQVFDISPRQIQEVMDRAQHHDIHSSTSFGSGGMGSGGGTTGGLTLDMLESPIMARSDDSPADIDDDLTSNCNGGGGGPNNNRGFPSTTSKPVPTDSMLHAAMGAMPLGYVVSTFLLYEMQDKMYKHRLIPIGVRGTFQHNREDFAVEGEFAKLAYNLWHSVRKFRQSEPLCDMFLRVIEGEVPTNIYEHSRNVVSVLRWRLSAQDPSGSGQVSYSQITSAILSIAAEQPIGVWKQLLFAVNQTMKDNHIPLHGKISITTLFAHESNHNNVGERPNAVTTASQIAGSSLLLKSLRRIVTHKFCDLFAIIEALLLPLVRESSLVPGMAVIRIPHAIQRLKQFEEDYSSLEYTDAVQYGLSILASRAPNAAGKLLGSLPASNLTPASYTTVPSQYVNSSAQQMGLMDARDEALKNAKGAPASSLSVNNLAPSAVGSLSQYLSGGGLLDAGGGGSTFPFFATHKHPIITGDNSFSDLPPTQPNGESSLPPPSMFGDGTSHSDGAAAATPYVPTSTFFHCDIAGLVEEVADTLPRMNASMHLLEEAVKNTRQKRRKSKTRRSQSGGGNNSVVGTPAATPLVTPADVPAVDSLELSARRGTLQPGDRTSISTSGTFHPATPGGTTTSDLPQRPRPVPVKRVTAVSVANAKDDQELVEWYRFLRQLRTYIRPISSKIDAPSDLEDFGSILSRSASSRPPPPTSPDPPTATTAKVADGYSMGRPYFRDLLFREVSDLEDLLATHVAGKRRTTSASASVETGTDGTRGMPGGEDNTNVVLGEILRDRLGVEVPASSSRSGINTPFSVTTNEAGSMSPPGRRSATPKPDDDSD